MNFFPGTTHLEFIQLGVGGGGGRQGVEPWRNRERKSIVGGRREVGDRIPKGWELGEIEIFFAALSNILQ